MALTLQAQTPAPSAAPAGAGKPIRHLEYSLAVGYVTNGEGHSSGMSAGGEGGAGSGVNSGLGGGGRTGTIDADVVGFTPDGALIIGINEMLQSAPRPEERFTCTVYGDGHVMCPDVHGQLTDAENLLLSMLGRGFIDPNLTATGNHWERKYEGKDVGVVTDYTMVDPADAQVTIERRSTITSRVHSVGDSTEEGTIVYDRTLSVPDSVHDTVTESYRNSTLLSTIDLKLISDSFAKP